MPDNLTLTASEVEKINAAMLRAFPYFPELSWKRLPDFHELCEMIAPHLPALLRAWEEQQPWRNAAAAAEACLAEEMEKNRVLLARSETAEHEREVMRRALDAARAEVADLKRERDEAFAQRHSANELLITCRRDLDAARAECERLTASMRKIAYYCHLDDTRQEAMNALKGTP